MKLKFLFSATLLAQLAQPALAADEEVLLTITGDRIELLKNGEQLDDADYLVLRYYQLLPLALQERLQLLRHRMDRRMEDYEVAFAAGDTAEINEIVDDLSAYWARIQQIHFEEFTLAAMQDLGGAYAALYFLIEG
ncbi:MAG: hypothetical protein CMQ14_07555 [Gammaproteobacteria bacterium]|nr:hypothetical protein [Gammaproteobacteria bacterium]